MALFYRKQETKVMCIHVSIGKGHIHVHVYVIRIFADKGTNSFFPFHH